MSASDTNLKVMTFNLRVNTMRDLGNRWSKRISAVVEAISTHEPMVLGVQECTRAMLTDLLPHLPSYAFVGRGNEGQSKGEYTAILYQKHLLTLQDEGQFWLSTTPEVPSRSWGTACTRICTWAQFQSIEFPHIQFLCFNTHLDHISQQARQEGSMVIWHHLQNIRTRTRLPVVLMGDFNAHPSSAVVRFWRGALAWHGESSDLRDAVEECQERIGQSYHGFVGGLQGEPIDYIFVSSEFAFHSAKLETRQFQDRYPSDHYPLVAHMGLPGKTLYK